VSKSKKGHEEHENSERWLLTYADLITLLLGLFVILYAMSKIDAGKYQQLVAALGGVFGKSNPGIVAGGAGVLQLPVPTMKNERQRIEQEVQSALRQQSKAGLVRVSHSERGITIHIMEELLFASGSAELKQASLQTLDTLARVLRGLPNDVRVEGHTDDVPIHTVTFESNWHLSVARALNTACYLIERDSLVPERVSVAGYGEYSPLVPNTSAENRTQNRRVDIVIVTKVKNHQPHAEEADSAVTH
jgi:chemotaxis protein MotB